MSCLCQCLQQFDECRTGNAGHYQIVAIIGGLDGGCRACANACQRSRLRIGLTEVGKGKDVAVVGDCGSHIGAPYLHADNLDIAVDHWQGTEGFVVVVAEVLGYEVVAVVFVLVGAYLEFLCAGSALHLQILCAGLFLTHHGVDGEFSKLQFGVESEELLATFDECCVERERDVGGFEQLNDIVFLTFVFQFDLVLEVEGRLCIPVEVKVDKVAYFGVETDLDVFIKIEGGDAAFGHVERGIFPVVVYHLESKVGATGGGDLDFGFPHE